MKHSFKIHLALALLALSGGVAPAQTGNDLFQQALVKERTDGNVTEAIALYEKIVQQHGADRKLAAKALYQMGQAHEKLGQTEARRAYERIARDFADQKDVAADAGRRLAALSGTQAGNSEQPRQVSSFGAADVTVSTDGRWMTATVWGANHDNQLVVHDTATGETRRLLSGVCGEPGIPCTYSDLGVLSPDAKHVAFGWSDDAQFGGKQHLRVIANEAGAAPRTLVQNAESNIFPRAWSPDSKSILVMLGNRDTTTQLGWVSFADGTLRIIKSLERRVAPAAEISLSPDGRYIAYAAPATDRIVGRGTDPTDTQIYLLAADGSSEVALVKTAGVNRSPVWTPDGTHVIFTSDHSGKTDLWSIAVRNGKAEGSLTMLKRDIGEIRAIGITKAGTFYFNQFKTSPEQVHVAELNPNGGSRILESFVGINPSWSPDGKSLAFKRHGTRGGSYSTVIRSVETGQEMQFSLESVGLVPPRWLHDGSGFLTGVLPVENSWFQFVDVKNNSVKRTIPHSPFWAYIAAISPDDKTLYTMARDPDDGANVWDRASLIWPRIIAVDLATGQERDVFRLPGTRETLPHTRGISLTLSPDGRTLAFAITNPKTSETSLARVDVDGSNLRHLYGPYRVSYPVDRLKWTKDGRWIIIAEAANGSNSRTQIMRISSEGGTPESTGLTIRKLFTFDVSPDGSRIAYCTDQTMLNATTGLFAIDNLPALLNGAK